MLLNLLLFLIKYEFSCGSLHHNKYTTMEFQQNPEYIEEIKGSKVVSYDISMLTILDALQMNHTVLICL